MLHASQEKLLEAFDRAKRERELYVNTENAPLAISRLKKFIRHPYRVARVGLYRAGISKGEEVQVKMFWGGNLLLPLWDEDAVLTYYTGSFGLAEILPVRFLIKNLHPSDVLYDIGANFGLYSALGEALGAHVHIFEPSLRTSAYIVRNKGSSSVINKIALSDSVGETVFFEVALGGKTGMSSLFVDMISQSDMHTPIELKVTTTTLDEYVSNHTPPTFIKLDVVNSDNLVLRGARHTLINYAPVCIIRIYNTPRAIERTRETFSLLKEYGYDSFRIQEDGSLAPENIAFGKLDFASTFVFKKQNHA